MTKPMPVDAPRLKARPGQGVHKKVRGTNASGGKGVEAVRARGFSTANNAGAAMVDPDKPLTEMQKKFVKLWASGDTILASAIKAGYSDGGQFAYRMTRMPNILKLYNAEKEAYESAANMSRKKVMDMLIEGYEFAKILEEPAVMVSAAREIGKMCGYYEPVTIRHQVTHDGQVVHKRVESMGDDELLEFIATQMATISAEAQPAQLPPPETDDVTDVEPK